MANDNAWDLTNGHGYILDRDRSHAAASRLNLQFYLWKDALKYIIHPTISATLPKTATIAEVASGTCLWLIDVAREYPEAQLDGFDYNLRQAPAKEWLPSNAKTAYWNVFDEPPEELKGRYDYVHTRLLVLVVEAKDPRPIIRNLFALLKPGGYLQWDELDATNMYIRKVRQDQDTPALDFLKDWAEADGRRDWTVKLPQFFTELGFQDAKIDFVGEPPELARAYNDQHLLTAEEFAEGLVKLGQSETASKYFRMVEQAYEESTSGAGLCAPKVVCTARKPI
jgi:SAM-dependent methyltransferase